MGRESINYRTFSANIPKLRTRLDRVENLMVDGMPDVNMCIDGHEFWIELKSPIEPKRPGTPLFGSNHQVTLEQRNWMLRHLAAGGVGFYLISTPKRWMLIPGRHHDEINKMTVMELLDVSLWTTNKPLRSNEPWIKLREALKRNSKPNHSNISLNV